MAFSRALSYDTIMPLALLKHGLFPKKVPQRFLPRETALKSSYDVVIIGGGGHGLATAYYLIRDHGIKSIAILEQGYIGGGNTGRNTTIIRSNYLTPQGVREFNSQVQHSPMQPDRVPQRPSVVA